MSEADSNVVHQYLSFFVGAEEYGIGILQVREIIEYSPVTKMPSMPASIRGVTNLRGRVVPVVDLAVRLGLPETPITKRTCIVMVEARLDGEESVVGLLVDAVSQVMDLPPAEIEPPPSFGTRIRVEFVRGMGKVGSKFVPLLHLDRLLDAADLLAAGRPAAAEAPVPPEAVSATQEIQVIAEPAAGAAP